jgi:DNA repair exonuclease SbcCD ATPase subunit
MNTEEFMKNIETIRIEAEKSTQAFIEETQNEYKYITTKLNELKNMKEKPKEYVRILHHAQNNLQYLSKKWLDLGYRLYSYLHDIRTQIEQHNLNNILNNDEKQKIYELIYSLSQNLSESYKTLLELQNLVNTLQNITEKTIEIEYGNNIY